MSALTFPIFGHWSRPLHREIRGRSMPWGMIEPHEKQALNNHGGQTLKRLAQRGGLSPCEALAVMEDRPWVKMDEDAARKELDERIERWIASGGKAQEQREASIRADVFNPNESDLEYFLRRKAELERRRNEAAAPQPAAGQQPK